MPATLRVTRKSTLIELHRGRFDIWVDGQNVGSVNYGDTFEEAVEPGHHTLRIRGGRYSSHEHAFDATDGETVGFHCSGAIIWPLWLASLVKPDLGLWLRRE
jgi:hypothetical protein